MFSFSTTYLIERKTRYVSERLESDCSACVIDLFWTNCDFYPFACGYSNIWSRLCKVNSAELACRVGLMGV